MLRTLLIERASYERHLAQLRDREGFDIEPALAAEMVRALPSRVWLVEVSAPELFSVSRRRFGEVLIAADQPPSAASVLAFRAPGLVVLGGEGCQQPHYARSESGE